MSVAAVTSFFALLAVALQLCAVGVGLTSARPLARARLVNRLGPPALPFAAAVAATCTAGSLYLSEVAHFTPCRLCWYQRICMYPLAVVLVAAVKARDAHIARYVLPLAGIGAVIAGYHILLERFPSLESSACDPANPCSLIWVQKFGYVTIPVMALTGFAAIAALVVIHRAWSKEH